MQSRRPGGDSGKLLRVAPTIAMPALGDGTTSMYSDSIPTFNGRAPNIDMAAVWSRTQCVHRRRLTCGPCGSKKRVISTCTLMALPLTMTNPT